MTREDATALLNVMLVDESPALPIDTLAMARAFVAITSDEDGLSFNPRFGVRRRTGKD